MGLLIGLLFAMPAWAHADHDQSSFVVGFLHPIFGLDHLLAMIAVGFLSARMEPKRMWTVPLSFVALMAAGGLLGFVWKSEGWIVFEHGIALSVLLFGIVVAAAPKVPLLAGNLIVAVFAICHGHAHISEMGDASAAGYFPGMLVATALLHLAGLLAGIGLKQGVGEWSVRVAGGAVSAVFLGILVVGMF